MRPLASFEAAAVLATCAIISRCSGDKVCPTISVSYHGAPSGQNCSGTSGVYHRAVSDFGGQPFFVKIDPTTTFYIYHTTTNERASWRLSPSAGSVGDGSVCEYVSWTTRGDPTAGGSEWSGQVSAQGGVTVTCTASNADCYANTSRPSGCSCEYIDDGTVLTDESMCSTGCCKYGECQGDKTWCLRWYIIGAAIAVVLVMVVCGILWKNEMGDCLLPAQRKVAPAPTNSEFYAAQAWNAEVEAAAKLGVVMTWFEYGETVDIPTLEIYELRGARVGVTQPSLLDPIMLALKLDSKLEMGGLSFTYTKEMFEDDLGICEGQPLVLKYVPYTEAVSKLELPRLKKQGTEPASRKSPPKLGRMLKPRRTSTGGLVNGYPLIRPGTGQEFVDPFLADVKENAEPIAGIQEATNQRASLATLLGVQEVIAQLRASSTTPEEAAA